MMMPSLNLFSPPKVTIKRRRYVSYDDTDDHDDNENSGIKTTNAPIRDAITDTYAARPTKRHRRCITPVPSFTNLSLFLPILEDPETAIQEGGSPPTSLPLAYRQEEEDERRQRQGGRSVSPSNYHFDETTPFLQPKMKKRSFQQDIKQEEQQPYDIEQEEYLKSYLHYGSPEGTVQQQRQRHTPRRVLPTPSPFLSYSSSSPVTTHSIDADTIVEQFQRAIRLSSEEQDQKELPSSLPTTPNTTTIKTPPLFDMLRY